MSDLDFKVKGQGHEINFSFFDIPDLKNARIDTKIKFVSRFLQEVTKVIQVHMYDLDFQDQPVKVRQFILVVLTSLTPKMLESTPRSSLYHVYSQR